MKNLPQALMLVLGLAWLCGGLLSAFSLVEALRPDEAYFRTEGEVLGVQKHTDSNEGVVRHLAEVSFQYGVDGRQLRANSLTPLCQRCTPDEVFQVLRMRPSQVPEGLKVAVWVLKSNPERAYLALPSKSDVVRQCIAVLCLLIAVPAFFAWQFKLWGSWQRAR
ncbi:DUF3592 domain-containing protein [Roseateles sp.]|uniref:DUF3592 domain-containing protein n=1 Tax=Roseateles sp. TaxID=1971397 RepID=UPI0032646D53